MDEIFDIHTWYNEGDPEATDNNSVINKENMNDLENRIKNAIKKIQDIFSNSITFGTGILNSTDFKSGSCYWVKIGTLVLVQIELLQSSENKSGETIIFTGLPAAKGTKYTLLTDSSESPNSVQSRINETNFQIWYDSFHSNLSYFTTFWYEAKE